MAGIATALAAVGALWFNGKAMEQNGEQLEMTRQGQVTDRFSKAVDQLGDDSMDTRLGGIYALRRIAQDSPRDREATVDVLTAFYLAHDTLAKHGTPSGHGTPADRRTVSGDGSVVCEVGALSKIARDALATLNALMELVPLERGASEKAIKDFELHGNSALDGPDMSGTYLSGIRIPPSSGLFVRADLRGVDLQGARLDGVNFGAASLNSADLSCAYADSADLQGVELDGARLDEAELRGARMPKVALDVQARRAILTGADFHGRSFSGIDLRGSTLNRADIRRADLSDANLRGADLSDADLRGADLRGADLRGANLKRARLDDVKWAGARTEGIRGMNLPKT
ncbi:pentapeptide repeat-containing protein [Streptomyces nigrescens]|uniref:pentapeptide repeat-containing protein n=1 Tax=Streptomyces nigrescens TaxID=1920 RepID=UPI003702D93E